MAQFIPMSSYTPWKVLKNNLLNEYANAIYIAMIFVVPTGLPLVPGPMAARTHSKLTQRRWKLTDLKEAVR